MRLTIIGAGAVGLNLGSKLALSGCDVLFAVRRAEVADAIRREGVRLEDPASGATRETPARSLLLSECSEADLAGGPALVCVRANETAGVAATLGRLSPGLCVVSAQNDVDNEAELARHFDDVMGLVVRQTCTLAGPRGVLAAGRGRLVLGRYPAGVDAEVERLAEAFSAADFDVSLSARIGDDKWLKLCVNLTSSANALIRKTDHKTQAFVEIKARLLEEAAAALAAADIQARSCDGRDRSLAEEIAAQRSALANRTSHRTLPLYNAVWAALRNPRKPLEADLYHRRIIALAEAHELAAPTHAVMLDAVTRAYEDGRGPECYAADELLARAHAGRKAPPERASA